jgi:hypothetical protein
VPIRRARYEVITVGYAPGVNGVEQVTEFVHETRYSVKVIVVVDEKGRQI